MAHANVVQCVQKIGLPKAYFSQFPVADRRLPAAAIATPPTPETRHMTWNNAADVRSKNDFYDLNRDAVTYSLVRRRQSMTTTYLGVK